MFPSARSAPGTSRNITALRSFYFVETASTERFTPGRSFLVECRKKKRMCFPDLILNHWSARCMNHKNERRHSGAKYCIGLVWRPVTSQLEVTWGWRKPFASPTRLNGTLGSSGGGFDNGCVNSFTTVPVLAWTEKTSLFIAILQRFHKQCLPVSLPPYCFLIMGSYITSC